MRTSIDAPGNSLHISRRAASPFDSLRTAMMTSAPAAASRLAASLPVPLLAPVTTIRRPRWSRTLYIRVSLMSGFDKLKDSFAGRYLERRNAGAAALTGWRLRSDVQVDAITESSPEAPTDRGVQTMRSRKVTPTDRFRFDKLDGGVYFDYIRRSRLVSKSIHHGRGSVEGRRAGMGYIHDRSGPCGP